MVIVSVAGLVYVVAPTFDPADMPSIPAGATRAVPYEEISRYDEGTSRVEVVWMTRDEREGATFEVDLQ